MSNEPNVTYQPGFELVFQSQQELLLIDSMLAKLHQYYCSTTQFILDLAKIDANLACLFITNHPEIEINDDRFIDFITNEEQFDRSFKQCLYQLGDYCDIRPLNRIYEVNKSCFVRMMAEIDTLCKQSLTSRGIDICFL